MEHDAFGLTESAPGTRDPVAGDIQSQVRGSRARQRRRSTLSYRRAIAVVALLGVMVAGLSAPQPASALSCGPCPATTTDRLNLREAPSLSADVRLVMPAGA